MGNMVYVTKKAPPRYRQMSFEEFMSADVDVSKYGLISHDETNTRTDLVKQVDKETLMMARVPNIVEELIRFNRKTEYLRNRERKELYREFFIPKKKLIPGTHRHEMRRICAPNDDLMQALRDLKQIFDDAGLLYHTSAFAYVTGRNNVSAVKRHQANESKWFLKTDFSDFFGSTTLDFVCNMFSMIFPMSEVVKFDIGKQELRKALELAFLDGGLPQGTPISPTITNIMMIPIDFELSRRLNNIQNQRYIYTRYADDILISSRYSFRFRSIEALINEVLRQFDAPFKIKSEKTRYGSSSGSNWNLGVMLNKDNNITIGHKRKKQFETMLFNYAKDKKNGERWEIADVQELNGFRSYYKMIEGEVIDRIVKHVGDKVGVDIPALIKEDLKS